MMAPMIIREGRFLRKARPTSKPKEVIVEVKKSKVKDGK